MPRKQRGDGTYMHAREDKICAFSHFFMIEKPRIAISSDRRKLCFACSPSVRVGRKSIWGLRMSPLFHRRRKRVRHHIQIGYATYYMSAATFLD